MSLLSVVIPSFNEEAVLPRTVQVLSELLKNENISY
jgi:glycosyltransferase involved in cell wall biosynthesis